MGRGLSIAHHNKLRIREKRYQSLRLSYPDEMLHMAHDLEMTLEEATWHESLVRYNRYFITYRCRYTLRSLVKYKGYENQNKRINQGLLDYQSEIDDERSRKEV